MFSVICIGVSCRNSQEGLVDQSVARGERKRPSTSWYFTRVKLLATAKHPWFHTTHRTKKSMCIGWGKKLKIGRRKKNVSWRDMLSKKNVQVHLLMPGLTIQILGLALNFYPFLILEAGSLPHWHFNFVNRYLLSVWPWGLCGLEHDHSSCWCKWWCTHVETGAALEPPKYLFCPLRVSAW